MKKVYGISKEKEEVIIIMDKLVSLAGWTFNPRSVTGDQIRSFSKSKTGLRLDFQFRGGKYSFAKWNYRMYRIYRFTKEEQKIMREMF